MLFAPSAQFGFRKNYAPGHYNMRFTPSQGLDGNYIGTNAPYHGPDGAAAVSTHQRLCSNSLPPSMTVDQDRA